MSTKLSESEQERMREFDDYAPLGYHPAEQPLSNHKLKLNSPSKSPMSSDFLPNRQSLSTKQPSVPVRSNRPEMRMGDTHNTSRIHRNTTHDDRSYKHYPSGHIEQEDVSTFEQSSYHPGLNLSSSSIMNTSSRYAIDENDSRIQGYNNMYSIYDESDIDSQDYARKNANPRPRSFKRAANVNQRDHHHSIHNYGDGDEEKYNIDSTYNESEFGDHDDMHDDDDAQDLKSLQTSSSSLHRSHDSELSYNYSQSDASSYVSLSTKPREELRKMINPTIDKRISETQARQLGLPTDLTASMMSTLDLQIDDVRNIDPGLQNLFFAVTDSSTIRRDPQTNKYLIGTKRKTLIPSRKDSELRGTRPPVDDQLRNSVLITLKEKTNEIRRQEKEKRQQLREERMEKIRLAQQQREEERTRRQQEKELQRQQEEEEMERLRQEEEEMERLRQEEEEMERLRQQEEEEAYLQLRQQEQEEEDRKYAELERIRQEKEEEERMRLAQEEAEEEQWRQQEAQEEALLAQLEREEAELAQQDAKEQMQLEQEQLKQEQLRSNHQQEQLRLDQEQLPSNHQQVALQNSSTISSVKSLQEKNNATQHDQSYNLDTNNSLTHPEHGMHTLQKSILGSTAFMTAPTMLNTFVSHLDDAWVDSNQRDAITSIQTTIPPIKQPSSHQLIDHRSSFDRDLPKPDVHPPHSSTMHMDIPSSLTSISTMNRNNPLPIQQQQSHQTNKFVPTADILLPPLGNNHTYTQPSAHSLQSTRLTPNAPMVNPMVHNGNAMHGTHLHSLPLQNLPPSSISPGLPPVSMSSVVSTRSNPSTPTHPLRPNSHGRSPHSPNHESQLVMMHKTQYHQDDPSFHDHSTSPHTHQHVEKSFSSNTSTSLLNTPTIETQFDHDVRAYMESLSMGRSLQPNTHTHPNHHHPIAFHATQRKNSPNTSPLHHMTSPMMRNHQSEIQSHHQQQQQHRAHMLPEDRCRIQKATQLLQNTPIVFQAINNRPQKPQHVKFNTSHNNSSSLPSTSSLSAHQDRSIPLSSKHHHHDSSSFHVQQLETLKQLMEQNTHDPEVKRQILNILNQIERYDVSHNHGSTSDNNTYNQSSQRMDTSLNKRNHHHDHHRNMVHPSSTSTHASSTHSNVSDLPPAPPPSFFSSKKSSSKKGARAQHHQSHTDTNLNNSKLTNTSHHHHHHRPPPNEPSGFSEYFLAAEKQSRDERYNQFVQYHDEVKRSENITSSYEIDENSTEEEIAQAEEQLERQRAREKYVRQRLQIPEKIGSGALFINSFVKLFDWEPAAEDGVVTQEDQQNEVGDKQRSKKARHIISPHLRDNLRNVSEQYLRPIFEADYDRKCVHLSQRNQPSEPSMLNYINQTALAAMNTHAFNRHGVTSNTLGGAVMGLAQELGMNFIQQKVTKLGATTASSSNSGTSKKSSDHQQNPSFSSQPSMDSSNYYDPNDYDPDIKTTTIPTPSNANIMPSHTNNMSPNTNAVPSNTNNISSNTSNMASNTSNMASNTRTTTSTNANTIPTQKHTSVVPNANSSPTPPAHTNNNQPSNHSNTPSATVHHPNPVTTVHGRNDATDFPTLPDFD